ncbi:MAG TPA: S8 family serine peptidase [Acidimicrobiia bacterium]
MAAAVLAVAVAAPIASAAAEKPSVSGALTPSEVATLERGAPQRSIIILRNQHSSLAGRASGAVAARSAAVRADQSPIRAELTQVHATRVQSYTAINAISATITPAEIAHLQQNAAVQAVVPDKIIKGAPLPERAARPTKPATTARPHVQSGLAANPDDGSQQVCPSPGSPPLVEPEALQLMNAADQAGSDAPAAQNIVDGTGVKVGFIADGIDINNPDFIRANGQHVFADYQDFSGEGPGEITDGSEAFGDASAIAAQGRQSYDVSNFGANPLSAPCDISVLGVAPGATLYGLKVFGEFNTAYSSYFVQAIDYAVNTDHVNVLNESFGGDPYPDTKNDPISLADQAAVAAGVTVTVSSADAGSNNTIESPASNPSVISVGATTSYQIYAQTTANAIQLGTGGWESNNISSLSSSGQTMYGPGTVTVVAPGEANWAVCTPNTAMYGGCRDDTGNPSDVELFSGTSQSAPLTAGTVALVDEAYAHTHNGVLPTPALVKQIITSTATDLHAPADEQGAGLVNALKAVQLAESIHDTNGSPTAVGNALLESTSSLSATGAPGASKVFRISVTNAGSTAQTVTPTIQTLSATPLVSESGSVGLSDSDPSFTDQFGNQTGYVKHLFTVPSGTGRLDGRITWDDADNGNARARLTLFDPSGNIAAYSLPQGNTGFGEVDVHDPAPGQWTVVIWTRHDPTEVTGSVQFSLVSQKFVSAGRVAPTHIKLAPGATGSFQVIAPYPPAAGDFAGDLRMNTGGPDDSGIPITLRADVRISQGAGTFAGVLTGGNGRAVLGGDNEIFQFTVPTARPGLGISVNLQDTGYSVDGFLVDPNLQPVDIQTTAAPSGGLQKGMQFFEHNPTHGLWTLILAMQDGNPGQNIEEPFTGSISLKANTVTATHVPHAVALRAGTPTQATIHVTNSGSAEKWFFVDPRTASSTAMPLKGLTPTTVSLPVSGEPSPIFLVPTHSSAITFAATASLPIEMDVQQSSGDPDIESPPGTSPSVAYSAPQISPGTWAANPAEEGPFPAAAPAGTATVAATVQANGFDSAVSSPTGDVWLVSTGAASGFSPLKLEPGQSADIPVTFTPSGSSGTTVSGFLDVDAFNPITDTGDQLARFPYSYRIK